MTLLSGTILTSSNCPRFLAHMCSLAIDHPHTIHHHQANQLQKPKGLCFCTFCDWKKNLDEEKKSAQRKFRDTDLMWDDVENCQVATIQVCAASVTVLPATSVGTGPASCELLSWSKSADLPLCSDFSLKSQTGQPTSEKEKKKARNKK